MDNYTFLAGSYDLLTTDVGYPQWADYVQWHFKRQKTPVRTVAELACGTGSLTKLLAERGYEHDGHRPVAGHAGGGVGEVRRLAGPVPVSGHEPPDAAGAGGRGNLLSGQRQLRDEARSHEADVSAGI